MNRFKSKTNTYICNWTSGTVFVIAAIIYWLTADPSASFWDCPEYVTCASRLEVGHPPGNPVWMLAMRVATIPFPPHLHAYVINLWSGLFMAAAAFFLARIIFILTFWCGIKFKSKKGEPDIAEVAVFSGLASILGGLSFAVCDSAWFSAVEAEVYALSSFLTSLTVWLMLKWAATSADGRQSRLLILIAYIMGLSLGIHQLNLLCIPVCALIYVFRKNPGRGAQRKAWLAIFLSFILVALILLGMMPGALAWAETLERMAVNNFGLPYFSGAVAYPFITLLAFVATALIIGKGSRPAIWGAVSISLWLSGIFLFNYNYFLAAILSAAVGALAVFRKKISRAALSTMAWMFGFVMLGYFSFALILIRGYASPFMNEATPTDIFALSSYISRDQYGSTPLFYGPTPYSKPIYEEEWKPGEKYPSYNRYVLKKRRVQMVPSLPGARLNHRSKMLSHADSALNTRLLDSHSEGYLVADYAFSRVTTPELNMLLPRITATSPDDIDSYEDWSGMNANTMRSVEISETVDSLGNPATRMDHNGVREKKYSLKPTYLQNLRFLLSYQVGYMYFRYLLWNFMGRQNDIPSTGEIEHGNFITGIAPIDNAMLGNQSLMPPYASAENPGRNVYYAIPLILGIVGIVFLARSGRTAHRTLAIITMFFFMTGLAIVLYLNQSPGEPRERDYAFLGSYMAFCIWIAFGGIALMYASARWRGGDLWKFSAATAICLSVPLGMMLINYDDHDRSGRYGPTDFATSILHRRRPAIILTQGDNYTFPLWYARETLGVGKQHCVIDLSYLAVPGYVVNLMKQGKEVIDFIATPADIAYGAYSFTRIPADADTTPVPLSKALTELYSQRSGAPEFRHSRVTLPGKSLADTVTIDLRSLAGGSTLLPFKQLMLLDIMAANLEEASPKPLLFLHSVQPGVRKPFDSILVSSPVGMAYDPAADDSVRRKELHDYSSFFLSSNSVTPHYQDPVVEDQRRRLRGSMVLAANALLDRGDIRQAAAIVNKINEDYPYSLTRAGSFTVADSTFHEGLEFGSLLMNLGKRLNDPEYFYFAHDHFNRIYQDAREWMNYYKSLPPARRGAVSNSTKRIISTMSRARAMRDSALMLK